MLAPVRVQLGGEGYSSQPTKNWRCCCARRRTPSIPAVAVWLGAGGSTAAARGRQSTVANAQPRRPRACRGAVRSRDPCHSHFGARRHRGWKRRSGAPDDTAAAAESAMPPPGRHDHQAVNSGADWGSVQLAMVTLSTILVDVFSDIIYASS